MESTQNGPNPGDRPLETAIHNRVADIESAKYARSTEAALNRFASWARSENIDEPADITAATLRQYARHLRGLLDDDNENINTNSTVELYFNIVSAFLSWCVREGLVESNPAETSRAREPLPESDGQRRQEFWTERDREAICATADKLVDETLDNDPAEQQRLKAFRDRAIVYTLAYTGCRSAELFAIGNDDKRNGVRWSDIDFETGAVRVYGKNREREDAPLFEPGVKPLQRWQRELNPNPDWPVFPTLHLPTLYDVVPRDSQRTPTTVWPAIREYSLVPPAISSTGARGVLKRLCDRSGYEFDEPLRPHGARRGLGDLLYQEQAELAQEVLRHKNIETTHESYSDQRISRVKERGDSLLNGD